MKPALVLLFLLFTTFCFSQDTRVRAESVQLLEKANAVSTAPSLPNLERTVTFRVLGNGEAREGSFSRVVVQGTGRRDEYNFGDYHLVNVWMAKRVLVTGSSHTMPPEIMTMRAVTPIYLVRFDHEDIIHEITHRDVNGSPAHCIEFDTVAGEKSRQNEICVDASNGTLIYLKINDETIENSDFFPFAGALIPGKITYSRTGGLQMEIAQTMTVVTDVTPNVLAAPPNAEIHEVCTQFRRAFGVSMPQPKPGNGGGDTEIILRGMIGLDGKVRDAVVQDSERPDLNAEALKVIQQWVFTPAMCNGQPSVNEASFTVHFQGR